MEYLVGSTVTLVAIAVISLFLKRAVVEHQPAEYEYSQSHIHQLLYPFLPYLTLKGKDKEESQLTKHHDKMFIRVVVQGNKAYWIKDGTFYVSTVGEDGQVDKENAKQVDTMSMDKVELKNIIEIVEQLTGDTQ